MSTLGRRYETQDHWIDAPLPDGGLGELDLLLAESGEQFLSIPASPTVVRWLLRGTFVGADGKSARMIGAMVRGREVTPYFREIVEP